MARVIQQRKSGPPYLLILFVFLFLVSTVLAVLLYLDNDKIKKRDDELTKRNLALGGSASENPKFQEMLAEASKPGGTPVVAQMEQQLDRTTRLLTGNATSLAAAEAEAKKAFARMPDEIGLAQAVVRAYGEINTLGNQLKAKGDEVKAKEADVASVKKELATLDQSSTAKQAELNKKITDLDQKLTTAQAEREKAVSQLTEDRDKEIKSRDKTIAQLNDRIIRLEGENTKYRDKIAIYEDRKKDPTVDPTLDRQGQGKVRETSGPDTAYIDLGAGSRVRPGMTFSVFPSTGITKDANDWKAKILVTKVDENFSICRITSLADKKNPVVSGDVVFNPIYDRSRTYKFVVIGLFDIYKTRRPDLQGAEEIKALVQRWGGTVENEVTGETDYVVQGEEPTAPKAVEGGVPPPILPEVEKARQQYKDAKDRADRARIPILNTNRFLQLTGFDPSAVTGSK